MTLTIYYPYDYFYDDDIFVSPKKPPEPEKTITIIAFDAEGNMVELEVPSTDTFDQPEDLDEEGIEF